MNANERRRQILEVLCERRFDTISNLMFEFSVSRATIKRDIQELTLSYPIYTTLGNGGGVHVVDGYRIGKQYLTKEQKDLLEKIATSKTGEDFNTKHTKIKK